MPDKWKLNNNKIADIQIIEAINLALMLVCCSDARKLD
jgi:hypothetical protein